MKETEYPTISVCMATLNSAAILPECLGSLAIQDYPKDKIELIVGDGGSIDDTRAIVEQFGGKVFDNPLRTGESGKAVALKQAKNELVLILDSDNILPGKQWLKKMVLPFEDEQIQVSEPIRFTWRKEGGYIERYCALIGMNDPTCLFLGNYDRWNYVTQRWTDVPHAEEDEGTYLKVKLDTRGVPTIGANGTVFRREFLANKQKGDYLFDIDIIAKEISEKGFIYVAKVKEGIIHTFCESDFSKFIKKQQRRIKDYTFHKKNNSREFDWSKFEKGFAAVRLLKFIVYTLVVFPLFFQAIKGYWRKPDKAWLFHVPACWATLIVYSWGRAVGFFKQEEMNRGGWKQ